MKNFVRSILAIFSLLAIAAAVQAGDHGHQGHSGNHSQQQNPFRYGNWDGVSQMLSQFHQYHSPKPHPTKQPIPIDPGKGDGRVPVKPIDPGTGNGHTSGNPTPPARDGFVWVNDHWERARAPKSVTPYPADVVVRDHRTPVTNAGGGVVVRDHRTTTGSTSGGPVIRDHRTTTDWMPAGPTVRDHRASAGTASNASGGTIVISTNPRPGSDGPVIRDHRTTPVVRDHRTSGN